MHIDNSIKVYFVYGSTDNCILDDYDSNFDIIFPEIIEEYPPSVDKPLKAMKYIDSLNTYDFFIITNITTFWDFKSLHKNLNNLPTINCFSGFPTGNTLYNKNIFYISGVSIILSSDLIKDIINNNNMQKFETRIKLIKTLDMYKNINFYENNRQKINNTYYKLCDDEIFGIYFNGIKNINIIPQQMCFFEDIYSIEQQNKYILNKIKYSLNTYIHNYRVKNNINRINNDLYIYTLLLNLIYNIN
jgi:hypothetical protein